MKVVSMREIFLRLILLHLAHTIYIELLPSMKGNPYQQTILHKDFFWHVFDTFVFLFVSLPVIQEMDDLDHFTASSNQLTPLDGLS